MSETNNSVVATFNTHIEAEEAVMKLQKSGFDMKKLSVVGKNCPSGEHIVGYYNMGDRIKYWGGLGAFWSRLWELLSGSGVFFILGYEPVFIAGPMISWIIGALEGPLLVGGLSVIGSALYSIGIPKNSILRYEESLNANKFVLIFHNGNDEVENVCAVFKTSKSMETNVHKRE